MLKEFPSFPRFRFQYKGKIAVNKIEGVFEYSGNFQVCLVKAH